jgi:aspartyl-tRNA synthetase
MHKLDDSIFTPGEKITVVGWVHRVRNHGGLLFVDLRGYGHILQCVLDGSYPDVEDLFKVKPESVVSVFGKIKDRPAGTTNLNLSTGSIELHVESWRLINLSETLPFEVSTSELKTSEELRLKYRFLDLRREKMQHMLKLRSDVTMRIRQRMWDKGFQEITTPILTASSPEGARDYLVPSRLHPGKFYALPQAPQIFKQILMASGVKRYFQIAPCFRDESGRSDRSPGEFYQLDLEIAWATQDEVFKEVGDVVFDIFCEFGAYPVPKIWPQIPYKNALQWYGCDKPDLRAKTKMVDITTIFKEGPESFIKDTISKNAVVRALPIKDARSLTGKFYKDADSKAKELGMSGLGYIKNASGTITGPFAKFLLPAQVSELLSMTGSPEAIFFIIGSEKDVNCWATELRLYVAKETKCFNENSYEFCWVVDYPMFEETEDGAIEFSHNPFSMPQGGLQALKEKHPLEILAHQYDLVVNGVELSSGAIRNHSLEALFAAFAIAGYAEETVREKFPALVNAFRFGCPPHGGIAPGIERMLMLLTRESNIREVIPFPLTGTAQDLMMNAPSDVPAKHLAELKIKTYK